MEHITMRVIWAYQGEWKRTWKVLCYYSGKIDGNYNMEHQVEIKVIWAYIGAWKRKRNTDVIGDYIGTIIMIHSFIPC